MAINIKWQVKPPSKNRRTEQEQRQARLTMPCKKEADEVNEDKPLMFPRITDSEIVNDQQLAELMHPTVHYPEGMPRLLLTT